MNLHHFLSVLRANPSSALHIMLPDQTFVPAHFHITEVGRVQKDFIDCGGTRRSVSSCLLQVWIAEDVEHRLDTTKLAKIMQLAESLFPTQDLPVEVEYEHGLLSQFPLAEVEVTPSGLLLHLGTKHTACLASDRCGVDLATTQDCSKPGCC